MLLLGLVFNLIALASDSVWGLVAATARDWFARSPRRLSAVGGAGGLTMIGLGVTVAVTGRRD
jgi:threonine/homoserine/homoserine lactone efflux protein